MPGFFDDTGIKDFAQGIGNQAQAAGRGIGDWASNMWQEPSTKRGLGALALAPLAMLLAHAVTKRSHRQAAEAQTLGTFGNFAFNQFMEPSRQKDAYTQAKINSGEYEPVKPGEAPQPGDMRWGGMNFRKVPNIGDIVPELGSQRSQWTKEGPWAAGPGQGPAPLTTQQQAVHSILGRLPGTTANQIAAATALANEGKGDLATQLAMLRLDQSTARMNQPNYQFITDAQGNVVGVDRKNPQQHVDMGQIGKPASSSVEKPITLSPDSKLFPKNTSPDVLSGMQKAGWNITQNGDGSFIGQAPPKPPTDYQANQMIRGYHKDYMQEVGKIKNISAVVSYLKYIAPPGSQIPPVADSQFIIEYLRAANALGNFGIARINQAEMNLLQHARSLEDTAKNFYNLKIEGNLLTDEQRQGMIKTLEHMAAASKEAKGAIDKQYKTMLPSWIPPEKVIGDDDSSSPASVGPPPATGLPGGDVSVE